LPSPADEGRAGNLLRDHPRPDRRRGFCHAVRRRIADWPRLPAVRRVLDLAGLAPTADRTVEEARLSPAHDEITLLSPVLWRQSELMLCTYASLCNVAFGEGAVFCPNRCATPPEGGHRRACAFQR